MKTNVCAIRARWIPAFAGMTIVSEGVSFQMTPLPAAFHACHSTPVSDITQSRFRLRAQYDEFQGFSTTCQKGNLVQVNPHLCRRNNVRPNRRLGMHMRAGAHRLRAVSGDDEIYY
jgi:hypothetical protein